MGTHSHHNEKVKPKSKRLLKRTAKFKLPVLLAVALAAIVSGVYIIYNSLANNPPTAWNNYVVLQVMDPVHGGGVPGVDIRIRSSLGSPGASWYCQSSSNGNGASSITDGNGVAVFYRCPVSGTNPPGSSAQYYIYYAAKAGYYEHPASPYKVNTNSFTLTKDGINATYIYYMTYPDPPPPPDPGPPPPGPTPPPPGPGPTPPPPPPPGPGPTPPPPPPPGPGPTPGPSPSPGPTPGPTTRPGTGGGTRPPQVSPSQVATIQVAPATEAALDKEADQALEQLTTANVKKDEISTITSDDGTVTATFEAGTFDVDAECVIVTEEAIEGLAYGPYKIACQDKDGNELATFNKPVTIVFTLPENEEAKWHDFVTLDGQSKSVLVSEKNEESRSLSSKLESPMIFGVVKNSQSNNAAYVWGGGILILLILIGGAIWFIKRRQGGQDNFDDYIRNQYIKSGASGHVAAAPTATIDPGQRAGMSVHTPGTIAGSVGETHATSEHTALQQAQERLAQLQDPTPPAPGSVVDGDLENKPGSNPANRS